MPSLPAPENLSTQEILRIADHELALGRELSLRWQLELVKRLAASTTSR